MEFINDLLNGLFIDQRCPPTSYPVQNHSNDNGFQNVIDLKPKAFNFQRQQKKK